MPYSTINIDCGSRGKLWMWLAAAAIVAAIFLAPDPRERAVCPVCFKHAIPTAWHRVEEYRYRNGWKPYLVHIYRCPNGHYLSKG